MTSAETIAALATPVGTAAIAVVRASGPDVAKLTQDIVGELPAPRVARHGDYRDVDGQLVDDVLFTFFAAPHSYTGENTLEISCHGNPFIAQKLLEDLLRRGCRAAEAGEFTKRAFLNGRMDLSQAEAVMDLIHARSERALAAANQQLRGALGRRMEELTHGLINALALIEAYIDFPEEDLPPENRRDLLARLEDLQKKTSKLMATNRYGDVLRGGLRTVIIGAPNAGKSSLLNRLVGRERALVSAEPGTTRDYLEEYLRAGPHVLRLIDTAGLNIDASPLERRGITKSLEQAAEADLFVWVIDGSTTLPSLPADLAAKMTRENTLAVINKFDLGLTVSAPIDGFQTVVVSAVRGDGIDELSERLVEFADAHRIDFGDEVIAVNARHAAALERARNSLEQARANLGNEMPVELVASDLRETAAAFGEISGRIDNEKVLDALFATFCIGK